jgi:hypothetical protein
VKVVARDAQPAYPPRLAINYEVCRGLAVVGERGDGFEGRRLLAKERKMRARQIGSRGALIGFLLVEAHELARLLVRQRGQQHCLKNTKHRRGATDPHSERDDHGRGEARIAPHLSNCVG